MTVDLVKTLIHSSVREDVFLGLEYLPSLSKEDLFEILYKTGNVVGIGYRYIDYVDLDIKDFKIPLFEGFLLVGYDACYYVEGVIKDELTKWGWHDRENNEITYQQR